MHSRTHPHPDHHSPPTSTSSLADFPQHDLVAYSLRNYEPMLPRSPTPPATTPMLIHPHPPETMHDDDPPPFWSPPASHSPPPNNFPHNPALHLPSSPDHVQHLHQLNRPLSPNQPPPSAPDILPPQQLKHPLHPFHPSHLSLHHPVPPSLLSNPNPHPPPHYLLSFQHQVPPPAPSAPSTASSQLLSSTPHPMLPTPHTTPAPASHHLAMPPSAPQPTKHASHFCLPRNRSATPRTLKQDTTQLDPRRTAAIGPVAYQDEQRVQDGGLHLDDERYVKEAARIAEEAKLERREGLKEQQRKKEVEAGREGRSLSAKDKERERSRRESAVTRRRAEVYISELERHTRKVPRLEWKVASLEEEIRRLKRALADRANVGIKEEEAAVMLSPSSGTTRTTRHVVSALKELDL